MPWKIREIKLIDRLDNLIECESVGNVMWFESYCRRARELLRTIPGKESGSVRFS